MNEVKILENKDYKSLVSPDYNYIFNKNTGFFARWGKTKEEDPIQGLPEILDIEITTICDGATSVGCSACYKSNSENGINMTYDSFKTIIGKLPKSICQLAFGADATLKSNPDIWKMMEYSREKGIIPNITVASVDDYVADNIAKYCGACSVSRYSNKNHCYDTVKRLTDRGMNQVNIHFVLHEKSFEMALETLNDIKNDERLSKLNAIVFLSLKTKGRGKNFKIMSNEKFNELIEIAFEMGINFGFDSCSYHKFENSIKNNEKYSELIKFAEPCESSLFSTYIDVEGKFFPCSFTPNNELWGNEGIDVINCKNFLDDIWFNEKVIKFRETLINNERKCPLYNI